MAAEKELKIATLIAAISILFLYIASCIVYIGFDRQQLITSELSCVRCVVAATNALIMPITNLMVIADDDRCDMVEMIADAA